VTVRDALNFGFQEFSKKKIETPYLDASVLLAEALNLTKEKLFSRLPEHLSENELEQYRKFISLRLSSMPVSYIRRKKEFFGLEFYVDPRVLVPRPDTETLVETALNLADNDPGIRSIHDVCTGSGCIAVSLKHERQDLFVTASDISDAALEVFVLNARNLLRNEITWYKSDLLKNVPGRFNMICANPPYLTEDEVMEMKSAGWPEPENALKAGPGGMDVIKRLITEAMDSLEPNGYLLIEGASSQMEEIKNLMKKEKYTDILIRQDLAGRDRVITARKGAAET